MTTIEEKKSINQAVMARYGALSEEVNTLRTLYANERALEECLTVLKHHHSTMPGVKSLINSIESIQALYIANIESRR
jgi:acyl-[acyl carrier protein]--UDP-N-acetylglucosamine O-acyltransferase